MGFMGIRFEFGQCVLCEYDTAGTLKAQPDGAGQSPQVASYDLMYPLGFAARAPAARTNAKGSPLGGGGCRMLIGKDGTDVVTELKGDPRDLAKLPPLPEEGASVQYAPGSPLPSFDIHTGKDGTKTTYVEVDDAAHVITVGVDGNGEAVLEITHARGMALTFFRDKAVLKNRTGNVYAELNDDGGILNGNWKVTGAFDVGAVSFPLVLFPPLQIALTALAAAMTAINAEPAVSPATKSAGSAAAAAIAAFFGTGATTMTKGF